MAVAGLACRRSIAVVPERARTAVCLTNTPPAPAGRLADGLLNARVGLDPALPQMAVCPAPADVPVDELVGVYASGEGARVRIAAGGGGLTLAVEGQNHPLTLVGRDTFVAEDDGDRTFVRFRRGADGSVDSIAVELRVVPRQAGAGGV